MVECRNALRESSDDLEEARRWLRKHSGTKVSAKVDGREAAEGLVAVAVDDVARRAVLLRVASETDFAGRSETLSRLAEDASNAALSHDGDDVADAPLSDDGDRTVRDALEDATLSVRENLGIAETRRLVATGDDEIVAAYVHNRAPRSSRAGSAAAVVRLRSDDAATADVARDVGKRLAMHVVAAAPAYLAPDDVPADVLERERAILLEQMADSNKPSHILDKIIDGRLRKFYESVCLTEQEHVVEEGGPKVSKFLKEKGLEVTDFARLSV